MAPEDDTDDEKSSIVDNDKSAAVAGLTETDLEDSIPPETVASMHKATKAVRQARETVQDSVDWASLYDAIESYFENVSQVIASDIDGLEQPEDYDPDELTISPFSEQLAKDSTDRLIDELESGGYSDLDAYLDRLRYGRNHISNDEYGAAAFYFISVQDGIMSMLCDHFGDSTNSEGYYGRSDKVDAFARAYNNSGYHGVETGDVIPPYEDFYEHRNAIVHGSPTLAYLDRDIALLSMLFLMLTLDAAVSEMSQ
ncbi:MAG: hypothetical protein SV253_05550 [Halobacteria archaeon]|nr:hypothetical protein [Halobacteria archaeon]